MNFNNIVNTCTLIILLLSLGRELLSQDSAGVPVPDGTECDVMKISGKESSLDTKQWYEFENKYTSLKLVGAMLIDYANFLRITPMKKWYLSDNLRLEFVQDYGRLNRINFT